MNSRIKDKIVAKVLSGNATENETNALNLWLKENPLHQLEFDEAKKIWESSLALKQEKKSDADKAWADFKMLAENQPKTRGLITQYRGLKIAAAIALFVVLGFVLRIYFVESTNVSPAISSNISTSSLPESLIVVSEVTEPDTFATLPTYEQKVPATKSYKRQLKKNPGLITLVTRDSARIFLLPDKSIVFLNANSKLEYLANFNRTNRSVSLIGEAYFEVHQDSGQFIVACENTIVRGMSTSFNVKSHEKDKEVEVIVASGKVEFSGIGKKEFKKLTLSSGETGIYKKENEVFVKNNAHRNNYKWWKKSLRASIKGFFDKLFGRKSNKQIMNPVK